MPGKLFFLKCVILVACVVGAGFTIQHFVKIEKWMEESDELVADEPFDANKSPGLTFNLSATLSFKEEHPALDDHYLRCIRSPSKPFCLLSEDKRLELFRSENPMESPGIEIIESRIENVTANRQQAENSLFLLIADFLKFTESLDVKAFIIEPSILFCLLPSLKKNNLLMAGMNPGRVQGSRNIVTFGIFEDDLKVLNEVNNTNELLFAGFKMVKVHKLRKPSKSNETGHFEPVHFFFARQQVAAHVVIFYKRSSYLQHDGLIPDELDFKGLLFVDESIYENFDLRKISGPQKGNVTINHLFIPPHLSYFLKETESSRFVECRGPGPVDLDSALHHPFLTSEQMAVRVVLALREVKTVLAPAMVTFWLCSKTLLGWTKHCNVLHYTSELELAVGLHNTQDLNLTAAFSKCDFLKIRNDSSEFGSELRLEGHGLQVSITIFREEVNDLETSEREYFRLQFPKFPLCSIDVFGQKTNIPCAAM